MSFRVSVRIFRKKGKGWGGGGIRGRVSSEYNIKANSLRTISV